jgi:type IV secretory pathway VirB3-like protein
MARRSSVFHASLHRPKMVMGMDPKAFYLVSFIGAFMFATGAYLSIVLVVPALGAGRLLSKKDPLFMSIFLNYLDEAEAYSSIPRPEDWKSRPVGWGRGLPW